MADDQDNKAASKGFRGFGALVQSHIESMQNAMGLQGEFKSSFSEKPIDAFAPPRSHPSTIDQKTINQDYQNANEALKQRLIKANPDMPKDQIDALFND